MVLPLAIGLHVHGCETPKSPPGDYNRVGCPLSCSARGSDGVKHLNPRQGITTALREQGYYIRQEILGVKHLNPRQGITTQTLRCNEARIDAVRVKHLNPRQGITTSLEVREIRGVFRLCETPKSPPGDYNLSYSYTSPVTS